MVAGSGAGHGGHYVTNKDGTSTWIGSAVDELLEYKRRIAMARGILQREGDGLPFVRAALRALEGK